MDKIEEALRERLEMAGCYPLACEDGDDGERDAGLWFTPHLNRSFILPRTVTTNDAANAVLRAAGMEEAF
jgi:hypothetical protein